MCVVAAFFIVMATLAKRSLRRALMNVLFGEHGLSKQVGRPPRYAALLSDFLNNPDKTFLTLTGARVEALPDPEMKFEAPFLALNKSVVTMIRAIKE